ncbi:SPOR domain-containing protein [candidate division KSB1 bacterium]|nr:SPOR domain-containing protein [candidate division KSB1 bacterium]
MFSQNGFFKIVIFLIFMVYLVRGQEVERLLGRRSREEIRQRLEELERLNRKSAALVYLKAVIEPDARKALRLYEQVLIEYPRSNYTDDAKFKISQYYYSTGYYHLAREQYQDLVAHFGDSPLRDAAAYQAIQCLVALNQLNEAKKELSAFQRDFPNSPFRELAANDLRNLNTKPGNNNQQNLPAKPPELFEKTAKPDPNSLEMLGTAINSDKMRNEQARFTIQVGAYSSIENAKKQKAFFEKSGYQVSVETKNIDGQLLYLVFVNSFGSREQAMEFARKLNQKYSVSFQIVQLE